MIKLIAKYYLKFPPLARKAVDFSLLGFVNYAGVDFYQPSAENILLGADDAAKKLFV